MAQPYTRLLGSSSWSAAVGSVELATVPAGEVWIVRNISLMCDSAAAMGVWLDHGGLKWIVRVQAPTALTTHTYEGRQVLVAGDRLGFQATGGSGTVLVSGYVFPFTSSA